MPKVFKNMKRSIKRFFQWIVKSFQYSLILWDDFDWDWTYTLKMLKYKLERQRKCLKANNIIADADIVCKNIRIAEVLLERIIEDDYCKVENEALDKKWGEFSFRRSAGFRSVGRAGVVTEEDKAQYSIDMKRLRHHEQYMAKEDMTYLFKHLSKHLKTFWD